MALPWKRIGEAAATAAQLVRVARNSSDRWFFKGPASAVWRISRPIDTLAPVSDDDESKGPGRAPPRDLAKIPQGGVRRGLKLGAAFVGAMGRAAGRRWTGRDTRGDSEGDALAETLGNLKGLSMKLGQMLSYVDVHTPPSWKEALARLQHQSAAMPHDTVRRVIEEDLGQAPDALFSAWEPTPIAAASIGQVHRARLRNGVQVAVKVRYPEIDRVVRQDLDNFDLLRRFGGPLFPQVDAQALMAEMRERFLDECDYRKEAENQMAFREFFGRHEGIVVPAPFLDHCSERVLTTAYVDGQRFDDFVRTASEGERNRAARSIHNFAFQSIFAMGALNCDPHPGNYLFLPGAVAFLDFGCVRRFGAEFVELWRTMLRGALEQDHDRFREAVVGIGLVQKGRSFDFDAHEAQYLFLIRPWLTDDAVTLTPDFVAQTYRALLLSNPNRSQLRMPPELLFANRLQWGLYSVLARLRSTLPLRGDILDILYGPGEPRPAPFTESQLERYASRLAQR
jgi:predicted unusual protein kinase regulating ubiquinone biosynthesis (AarF/ABC1/UbiB family)